jgi:hypothetical protein
MSVLFRSLFIVYTNWVTAFTSGGKCPRSGVDPRVVVAELEETLDAGRRVLGALAVEAMGKADDKAGALEPLMFARGDERVEYDPSVVCEVAELRLPGSQGVW